MEILERSLIAYISLLFFARIIGRKLISQLTYFDYITGITIGSIASSLTVEKNIYWVDGLIALGMWTILPILVSLISSTNLTIKKLLDGSPVILVQNGEIIYKNLQKTRFAMGDMLEELRNNGVFDITEVEFIILETNGKLSVLLKSQKKPPTREEMGVNSSNEQLLPNIIIDGKIIYNHLESLNLTEGWLYNQLKIKNIKSPNLVALAFLDKNQKLIIHKKSYEPKNLDILE